MRRTLLVIGDLMLSQTRIEFSLNRFITYKKRLNRRKIELLLITYDDVIMNRLPEVSTRKLKIMLFFPYNHWNSQIEQYDKDGRIYGDINFGNDYNKFFSRVDRIIKRRYKDKNIIFINPPLSCALDRDKVRSDRLLRKSGILTPRIYNIKTVSQLDRFLDKGKALYIKPRFGAMGKGITYISRKGCYTNFLYRGGKIISHHYDYNWRFVKISNRKRAAFLKILIKKRFLFQEAVDMPIFKSRRFDIRIYVIINKVPYFYAKSAPKRHFITNWSQGGRIEKKAFLKKALSEKTIGKVIAVAKKVARIFNLNYAGVDVIADRDQANIYLLEAHSFPGYERGFNLMKFLADYL